MKVPCCDVCLGNEGNLTVAPWVTTLRSQTKGNIRWMVCEAHKDTMKKEPGDYRENVEALLVKALSAMNAMIRNG
jgi:hypothetical protein